MERMEFQNNTHNQGLNFSVRDGLKWSEKTRIGEFLEVCGIGKSRSYLATTKYLIICTFKDIPQFVLDNEHDPECRTLDGLRKAMVSAYGLNYQEINPVVTCVGYYI